MLVDDHSVVRAGISKILQQAHLEVDITEAANATTAFQLALKKEWDLILLDIRLPDRSGVELLKQLKAEVPKIPVLILSTYPESQYAIRLIHAGASGYLSKDADDDEIIMAVKLAVKGKHYISPVVAELMAKHLSNKGRKIEDMESLHNSLSDREYQVFLELAIGSGPNEIANKLHVSAKTISTHRTRILQKMGFTKNAEIVLYAKENDLY